MLLSSDNDVHLSDVYVDFSNDLPISNHSAEK